MALGELLAVRPTDHGQVRERRRRVAERLVDEHLTRGVGEVVVAADDVGDLHVRVVAHDGEVVGGASRRCARESCRPCSDASNSESPWTASSDDDGATVLGDLQAPHMRLAGVDARLRSIGGRGSGRRGRGPTLGTVLHGRLARGGERLRTCRSRDRPLPRLLQLLERGRVGVEALRSAGTGRMAPPTSGPSSQSRPSQRMARR